MLLPPTEESNELTDELDSVDAIGFVRVLRGVDSQLFGGWRQHAGLLDAQFLEKADKAVVAAAEVLRRDNGLIVLTGCGTSGRVAFLTARRYGARFRYCCSGGDEALLLSDELPEDDPVSGASELAAATRGHPVALLLGITCGLSAPYVAGQLDFALAHTLGDDRGTEGGSDGDTRFATAVLGFNPVALAPRRPVAGWTGTTGATCAGDAAAALAASPSRWHCALDPVVGPEAVAGSSRMKGGSATLLLADALCYAASVAAHASRQAGGGDAAGAAAVLVAPTTVASLLAIGEGAVSDTYLAADAIARVAECAAAAAGSAGEADGAGGGGGRLFYIGEATAGAVGVVDASEMPDTYGVPFDTVRTPRPPPRPSPPLMQPVARSPSIARSLDRAWQVRAFVAGGWDDLRNASGDLSGKGPLLRLSLAHFEADVLPTLTAADAVVLLGCGLQPSEAHAPPLSKEAQDAAAAQDDSMPSARLWALVPKLRAANVGSVSLLCAAPASQAAAVTAAATAAGLDASAVVALRHAGFGPGHGGLAELSLKMMCNAVSTCAACRHPAAAGRLPRAPSFPTQRVGVSKPTAAMACLDRLRSAPVQPRQVRDGAAGPRLPQPHDQHGPHQREDLRPLRPPRRRARRRRRSERRARADPIGACAPVSSVSSPRTHARVHTRMRMPSATPRGSDPRDDGDPSRLGRPRAWQVHGVDEPVPSALLGAPIGDHVRAATPDDAAKLRQQVVLPVAILLAAAASSASSSSSAASSAHWTTVEAAREALQKEPRVSVLLRSHLAATTAPAPAPAPAFAPAAASATAAAAPPPAPEGYALSTLAPPFSTAAQTGVYDLLLQYGAHYPDHFGPDMRLRLAAPAGGDASGLLSVAAWSKADAPTISSGGGGGGGGDGAGAGAAPTAASHACVIFDEKTPAGVAPVGLFGAVITAAAHQRRGLSGALVTRLLSKWDAQCSGGGGGGNGGSVLILGTGSPTAARIYQRHGFAHLMGGFDGKRGYNPEDQGEWMLARAVSSDALVPFRADEHYAGRDAPAAAFVLEPLRRGHWAELCLLFTSFEADGKCAAAGIDDGLEAEEKLCQLMNRSAASTASRPVAWVARHGSDGRVHGCRVAAEGADVATADVYVVPGCSGARDALGFLA